MDENFNINNEQNDDTTASSEEKPDIRFEVKETVDVVPAETKPENKKNIIFIIIAIILVAVVCGVVLFFVTDKDDDENPTETTTVSDDTIDYDALEDAFNSEGFTNEEGQSISAEEYKDYIQNIVSEATTVLSENNENPHTIVEVTINANANGEAQTEKTYDKDACEAIVKAFLDRSCYLEGSFYDDAGATPLAAAFDGDNFEMLTNIEGTELSVVRIDNKIYFKRTALKKYAQLTDAVMQMVGLSADIFSFDFGDKTYNEMKDHLTSITSVTIDGKDGVCFRYDKNGGFFNFYFINNELVQLDVGNDTQINTQFIISHFSSSVPGDMLSFKGYEEAGFMSLFADYM